MRYLSLAFLLLFASIGHAQTSKIQFNHGWIKQLPPVVPMRAAYMQINNPGAQAVTISRISSDAFEMVEMHETQMADGMMKMVQLHSIELPANSLVELKPGARHLMLMSPKRPINIGDRIPLNIVFSDGSTQTVQLDVRK